MSFFETRSLLRSTLSYGAVSSATLGAVFLLHVIAGRLLGATDYGRFSFALALTTLLLPLLDPGIYYLLIRNVARERSEAGRYLAHALSWKLICAPLYLCIVCILAYLIGSSISAVQAAGILAGATILSSIKEPMRSALLAHEKFGLDALTLSIERLSLFAVGSALLLGGFGWLGLCVSFLVVRAFDLLVIAWMVRRVVPLRLGTDMRFLYSMLKAALPIGAFYITLNVYNYIDTVMLAWLRGNEEVGWYSAAYRLYEGPVLIPSVIATIFMPRLARFFVEDRSQFKQVLKQGCELVIVSAVGITIVGFLAAVWIIDLTYGAGFAVSTAALKILLLGLPFLFGLHFLQAALIAVDRQRFVLLVAVAGLSANVGLNLILIPLWGFRGAAVATVAIEGLVFGILSVGAFRIFREGEPLSVAQPCEAFPVGGLSADARRVKSGAKAWSTSSRTRAGLAERRNGGE